MPGRRRRSAAILTTLAVLAGLGAGALVPASAAGPTDESSELRIGVLALADAIAALGQTPELAAPLPYTRTSLANVLQLDQVVVADLVDALTNQGLAAAMETVPGVVDAALTDGVLSFGYAQQVTLPDLPLAQDDGTFRFTEQSTAGSLDVTLATPAGGERFEVRVDENQPDPLLKFALITEPELELSVDIVTDELDSFGAREGFTNVRVTGGHYRLHRTSAITLRDPDGRGLLTLEDLRYSTLPDLFAVVRGDDDIDVELDLALPDSVDVVGGGAGAGTGTLTLTESDTPAEEVWPAAVDATRAYGSALDQLTGLTAVDGLVALSKYTGVSIALQEAGDVQFPQLGGGTGDLFAPADRLLDLLATSAVAQIRCGVAPGNPPTGTPAPGDTVYCDAVTPANLGPVTSATWSLGGSGSVETDAAGQTDAVGADPDAHVRIDGSDGEPDLIVTLVAGGKTYTARTLPRTVQQVVSRIRSIGDGGASTAAATLDVAAERLDVAVDIQDDSATESLPLGNPGTLGTLVGLTGLEDNDAATVPATSTDGRYDVGFGVSTDTVPVGDERATVLLPRDGSLLTIQGVAASTPEGLVALPARIGFLGVLADVTDVSLGQSVTAPAVSLDLDDYDASPVSFDDILGADGTLASGVVDLTSTITASVGFTATEQQLPGGGYATGPGGPGTGSATVRWGASDLPEVTFGTGYQTLRVFDPVPASFLEGTARVTQGGTDLVTVDIDGGGLFAELGVADAGSGATEVARRLMGPGIGCQNVTIVDADTLTCEGLAPEGEAAFGDGDRVRLIVLGDPFALRDGILEGFSSALNSFERLDSDNVDDSLTDDQYASTLPLVDLTPAQLASERASLREALVALADAATQDEGGTGGPRLPGVSSAQELAAAAPQVLEGYDGIEFALAQGALSVSLTGRSVADPLTAPLRFQVAGTGQVIGKDPVTVESTSTTTLAVDVLTSTARPAVSSDTRTASHAELDLTTALDGNVLQAGVGDLTLAAAGSTAVLDIDVETAYDESAAALTTTRSTTREDGFAAVADLGLTTLDSSGDPERLAYSALPTDSSGGGGAAQPAPESMEVRYIAEGLDGLATALGNALDGGAVRNADADGSPVAAPLIGTDLDASADVAGTLTGLTSALRDQLEGLTAVTPDTLVAELQTAVDAAVAGADGVTADGSAVATVDCKGTCKDDDGPTEWDEVTVRFDLVGDEVEDTATFDLGLAGVNVNSDKDIETTTSWTLPVELRLKRGVGPQVFIGADDALTLDTVATLPEGGIKAVVGYLPALLTSHEDDAAGEVHVGVSVDATGAGQAYDLFDLYDGKLTARPSFLDDGDYADETGIDLDFATSASGVGTFGLAGHIAVPWSPGGFEEVTYEDVTIDMGDVVTAISTPFKTVDPYLGPVRDVMDVLRTPFPVVSELSELGGGEEISMLSLLGTLGGGDARVDLALRIIGYVSTTADLIAAIAAWHPEDGSDTAIEGLAATGALVTLDPAEAEIASSCSETVKKTTPSATAGGASRVTRSTAPCEPADDTAAATPGTMDQTTNERRAGTRRTKESVTNKTKSLTGSVPGFSVPFLSDPEQLVDLVTGEGEATYFRIDFGSLVASATYTQTFGPIMAGPVPIRPFVGGSISVEGRLAVGFDSYPQTLAVRGLSHPGAVDELEAAYAAFDGGDLIREGFYIDDLDAEGEDVPEVKLVTTLEAGAGVSIGIITAGLKGGVTLTINLDLADPSRDGKLRAAEIRDVFSGDASCIFDASATIEAFIAVFIEIELLFTSQSWEFDLLRLGPYTLFEYGCEPKVPTLVVWENSKLVLTSGDHAGQRVSDLVDASDDYEVRQFDDDDMTVFEVSGLNYTQRVEVDHTATADGYAVRIFDPSVAIATDVKETHYVATLGSVAFMADGGAAVDVLKFLQGETFDDDDQLVTTPFTAPVTATGGVGNDAISTGDGADLVFGGVGDDALDTGLGNDRVFGEGGNDTINSDAGTDDVNGGPDHDRLQGGPGADRVFGGDGNDSVVGGTGRDIRAVLVAETTALAQEQAGLQARLGFDSGDVLVGGRGVDNVDGGDGSDVVVGGTADSLTGGAVADRMTTTTRVVNTLVRGSTNPVGVSVVVPTAKVPGPGELDTLCVSGTLESSAAGMDFVTGGPEADVLVGSDAPDVLDGGAGRDELCGLNGDDQLSGDGAAQASSNPVNDVDLLRGGLGNDQISGDHGADVAYGDDVTLVRNGTRVVDGSLGSGALGAGADYLDGGDGADVLSGGRGADQVVGGAGDDVTSGEGVDTAATGTEASSVASRLLDCAATTRVIGGFLDLNGDLIGGPTSLTGVVPDHGRAAGFAVDDGSILTPGSSTAYTGLLGNDVVVIDGEVDLDRDGEVTDTDTGTIDLPSMRFDTSTASDGDCILADDGSDLLRGGLGSDYLGSGEGTDLADGGDGDDVVLGDAGTDVLLGGPNSDVLVGGDDDDHLVGEAGEDRLRGNDGNDSLIGGTEVNSAADGQDVLLAGRGDDVLVAENGSVVSGAVAAAVAVAPWRTSTLVPASTGSGNTALRFNGSAVACGTAAATRWVTLRPGAPGQVRTPTASPGTPVAYDELYGGYECDFVFGSAGDDIVRGGQDDDVVEGGPGADLANGDAGSDVVIGGSTTSRSVAAKVDVARTGSGAPDGGDTIAGDGGPDGEVAADLIAGDNATPLRRTDGTYDLTLWDVAASASATTAGNDTIYGAELALTTGADRDRIFAQGGDDAAYGGSDIDYVEGNAGADRLYGGTGDDDLIGGSSTASGLLVATVRLTQVVPDLDTSAAGLPDGADLIEGGTGNDVVLGDNGRITRPTGVTSTAPAPAYRDVAMADVAAGTTSGSDRIVGDAGDDVLYGQLDDATATLGTGDLLEGGADQDALLGDLGVVTVKAASDLSGTLTRTDNSGMISEILYPATSWVPVTVLLSPHAVLGGQDVLLGDSGNDVVRGGGGRDLANGGADDDVVFGGDGDDVAWGGTGHDRLFGGYGADDLDLKARAGDLAIYATVAGIEDRDSKLSTTNGADLIYGGWGPDELQADQGAAGPTPGSDQLLDWVGNHNVYYVCQGAYGAGRTIRESSPDVMLLLSDVATAAGATALTTKASGGWFDLGMVNNADKGSNTKPTPGAPGNFTCEPAD
ncbi:hypothetical protein GCM10009843_03560 [Nocardioides bigeumensis]|uniref:Calcium-binding protein n=1 Tax=Nocardioides bigeumensis TaxID=433657 RepID=A0ABN2XS15_9ACTN